MCLSFCTNHTRAKNDFSSLIIMDPFAQIVHTLSLLSSSFYASILPTASFMIERYRSNGFHALGVSRQVVGGDIP